MIADGVALARAVEGDGRYAVLCGYENVVGHVVFVSGSSIGFGRRAVDYRVGLACWANGLSDRYRRLFETGAETDTSFGVKLVENWLDQTSFANNRNCRQTGVGSACVRWASRSATACLNVSCIASWAASSYRLSLGGCE